MSLVQKVIQVVGQRGSASVAEVAAELRGKHTRLQVKRAIYNAALKGLLDCKRGSGERQPGSGATPGTFTVAAAKAKELPKPQPKLRPPASVWELGVCDLCGPWPPRFDGGRVYISPEDNEEAL